MKNKIDWKFQAGMLYGISLGLISMRYFNLKPFWFYFISFFIIGFLVYTYSLYKEVKEVKIKNG